MYNTWFGTVSQKKAAAAIAPLLTVSGVFDIYYNYNTNANCANGTFNVTSTHSWEYAPGGAAGVYIATPSSGGAGTTSVTISYSADTPPDNYTVTFKLVAPYYDAGNIDTYKGKACSSYNICP